MNLAVAALGALPALAAMASFDRLDRKRPEPPGTLRGMAVFGALSAVPCAAIELAIQKAAPATLSHGYAGALFNAFVVAALVEELAKALCLRLFVWRRREFDERLDGIVYATRAGLGFAALENVLYLSGTQTTAAFAGMYVLRAVLTVPMHAIAASMTGYFAATRRFDGRGPGFVGGYALAVLVHGTFDAALFALVYASSQQAWSRALILLPVPFLVVGVGARAVRRMAARALAADDAERQAPPSPPDRTSDGSLPPILIGLIVVFVAATGLAAVVGVQVLRREVIVTECTNAPAANKRAACEHPCEDGRAPACVALGEACVAESHGIDAQGDSAARAYERACTLGDAQGCALAGALYERGEHIARDDTRAAALYDQGCEAGSAAGCSYLGYLTSIGRGVAKDEARSVELYRRGCTGGNARGCNNLGYGYEHGLGVPKDLTRAAKLYEEACDKKDGLACANLGSMLHAGAPMPKDDVRSRALFEKGCDGNERVACRRLAEATQNGQGAPADEARARALYQRACKLGDEIACKQSTQDPR